MFEIFKKKNKIEQHKPFIIGGTTPGKIFNYISINGLDLHDILKLLREPKNNKITIIELSENTKVLYKGNASNYNCERLKYEVIKFEKIFFDYSYTITVKYHNSDENLFNGENKIED